MSELIQPIWRNMLTALDAEVRPHSVVTGLSGIEHTFTALAVDDKHRRLLLISPNPDPKIAAMTQVDIQATMPDTRVIIARPIAVDLSTIARQFAGMLGTTKVSLNTEAFDRYNKMTPEEQKATGGNFLSTVVEGMAGTFKNVTLPTMEQIIAVIVQLQHLDWQAFLQEINKGPNNANVTLSLDSLIKFDNMANDRKHGVCPIPLYQFEQQDWELFNSEGNLDRVVLRLKELGIYQYFFPSADELTIGVVEGGQNTPEKITKALATTEYLGHPFGENAFVELQEDPLKLVDALKERGMLVTIEMEYDLGPEGKKFRASVRAAPKEGVVSKVINRMNINVDASKIVEGVIKGSKGV